MTPQPLTQQEPEAPGPPHPSQAHPLPARVVEAVEDKAGEVRQLAAVVRAAQVLATAQREPRTLAAVVAGARSPSGLVPGKVPAVAVASSSFDTHSRENLWHISLN